MNDQMKSAIREYAKLHHEIGLKLKLCETMDRNLNAARAAKNGEDVEFEYIPARTVYDADGVPLPPASIKLAKETATNLAKSILLPLPDEIEKRVRNAHVHFEPDEKLENPA